MNSCPIPLWERDGAQKEDADVIYTACVCEFEESMGLIDLLKIRLQESACYTATKHDSSLGEGGWRALYEYTK